MYSEEWRNKVDNPKNYDRMICLLMDHNPACKESPDPIGWATDIIHTCIRRALEVGDCATGMCMALRTQGWDYSRTQATLGAKVRLFLDPISPEMMLQGDRLRQRIQSGEV